MRLDSIAANYNTAMSLLSRRDIEAALTRLGELAREQRTRVELLVMGGAAMVLAYDARESTHDVDVLIRFPRQARVVRELAERVGRAFIVPGVNSRRNTLLPICGRQPMAQIEQIAQAILNGDSLLARALTQDFLRDTPRLAHVKSPAVSDPRIPESLRLIQLRLWPSPRPLTRT